MDIEVDVDEGQMFVFPHLISVNTSGNTTILRLQT